MAYDAEHRRSRVVVETPTARREVVQTTTAHVPERRGVSTGVVATVAILAIFLGAVVAWLMLSNNNTTGDGTSVRVATTQPSPAPPATIIQQPAPTQAQQPVIIQQPAPAPPTQTVVVPVPGSGTVSSPPSATTTTGAAAPKSNVPDDAAIQTAIDKKLRDDTTFSDLGLTATVVNGKVMLTGTVNSPDLKRQAERLIRTVKGVRDVDNQITVSGGE